MKLHTLDASDNTKITDEGIKDMKLHTLNACHNSKITDEGIKDMKLHTLDASFGSGITDEGIKDMKLHTLNASRSKIDVKCVQLGEVYYDVYKYKITVDIGANIGFSRNYKYFVRRT